MGSNRRGYSSRALLQRVLSQKGETESLPGGPARHCFSSTSGSRDGGGAGVREGGCRGLGGGWWGGAAAGEVGGGRGGGGRRRSLGFGLPGVGWLHGLRL